MKHIVYAFGFVVCIVPRLITAQTTTQNFIKKTSPTSAVATETSLNALSSTFKVEDISYIDGLGRTLQDVVIKGSPGNNDIIQPYFYDSHGRQSVLLLPYTDATMSGAYRDLAFNAQPTFYSNQTMVAKTTTPYSEVAYDGSPLNEVREKSSPDTDWQMGNGHTTKVYTSTNNDDEILFWYKDGSGDYVPDAVNHDSYYEGNTLTATKLTDPNSGYTYVYSDKKGKTICTKQFLELRSGNPFYLTTYMVYDDFGQLVLVIPPKAMELMDASGNYSINALTEDLVYRYTYDQRHRLIEKKVPGTGWNYIVYNQLNQPVLYRDANLAAQNKWSFMKYDVLGRPILSGLMNSSGLANYQTRALAQAQLDASQTAFGESEVPENGSNPFGYTNVSLPNQNLEILTVNYYDDYDFNNDGTADYTFNANAIPCVAFNYTNLGSIYNKMQTSVTAGTSMGGSLSTAISLSAAYPSLKQGLTNCLTRLNQLKPIMNANAATSTTMTLIEKDSLYTALNNSLSGSTSTLIAVIVDSAKYCLRNDPGTNSTLTTALNNIVTQAQALSNKTSTAIPLIAALYNACQPYSNAVTNRTRDYLTGSRVKVLDVANPVQWEVSAVFYDDEGQAIQSQSNDHMGGTDLINMVYDFVGNVIHTQQVHTLSGQNTIQVLNHMSFDKMGRLTRVDQKNNADLPVILSTYNYNELSQLVDKKVHSLNNGSSFLQSMDFRYNIQGWLSSINNIDLSSDMASNPSSGTNDDTDDLWGMQLNYNTNTTGVNGQKQYSGNVAEKKWRSVTDNVKRAYGYTYDKADRIKGSAYVEYNSGSSLWNSNAGKYDEGNLTYDANGNILTLYRNGYQVAGSTFGLIDHLSYQYNGNFLTSVTDASGSNGQMDFKDNGSTGSNEYTYDGNGNMTANPNKNITAITYNHLNLPIQITFSGSSKTIEYTYDALGTRLRKKVTNGSVITTKNYAGAFEYVDNSGSTVLESMASSEGRCVTTGTLPEFRYEYQYLDNTGNVVMAFSDMDFNNVINTGTEVIQQNHYYSFGMKMEGTGTSVVGVENKYKFSGKEMDDDLGLNEYDFGARLYDPAIARWGCIDPMADFAPNWTPFRYGFNNPVIMTDPTGMMESGVVDADFSEYGKIKLDKPKKEVIKPSTADQAKGGGSRTAAAGGRKGSEASSAAGASSSASSSGIVANNRTGSPGKKADSSDEKSNDNTSIAGYEGTFIMGSSGSGSEESVGSFLLGGSYRGREGAWMLGRGGVVSTADADATMGEKAAMVGVFGGAVIGSVIAVEYIPAVAFADRAGVKILFKIANSRSWVTGFEKLSMKELQIYTRANAEAMRAFFSSKGRIIPGKDALLAYRELAIRMMNGTNGAYQKLTQEMIKLHTERLEMINNAIKNLK